MEWLWHEIQAFPLRIFILYWNQIKKKTDILCLYKARRQREITERFFFSKQFTQIIIVLTRRKEKTQFLESYMS